MDAEHLRRQQIHGTNYHYNSDVKEPPGTMFRVLGTVIGDWKDELQLAKDSSRQEVWGSREENADIINTCKLSEHTPILNRIAPLLKFERVLSQRVQTQKPGGTVTKHFDDFTREVAPTEKAIRLLVMLEEWESGQALVFSNQTYTGWAKGEVIYSDFEKVPHATSNVSWNERSLLLLTGVCSSDTIDILAFGLNAVNV